MPKFTRLSSKPGQIEVHRVRRCAHCQAYLEEAPVQQVEKRQVYDLPPMRLVVTEHEMGINFAPERLQD